MVDSNVHFITVTRPGACELLVFGGRATLVPKEASCLFEEEKRMHTTWVLAADASRARIFEISEDDGHLHEIEDMLNPEGRMMEREINAEPKGRFYGKGERAMGHTGESDVEPTQKEVERFSKRVASRLDQCRNEHRFDKLRVVAAPKMLGLIRENLSKEVQKIVEEEIPKDISNLKEHEMEEYLKQYRH
jgi:protein required for attachment to host cells